MTTTPKPLSAPSTTRNSDKLTWCMECGKQFDPTISPICPDCYGLRNLLEAL